MKKIILILILLFLICFSGVIVIRFTSNTHIGDEIKLKTDIPVGVWWWDKTAIQYLNFAIQNDVDEIYYCDTTFNESTKNFISKAKQNNIKVFLLCGEHDWIEDKQDLDRIIENYKQYQLNNPNVQFDGIHLDVEPHQYNDFKDKREYYLKKYVEFAFKVVDENPTIKFDFDIPFWFNDIIDFDGHNKEVYKYIIDYANRVFVMSYRDSAQTIVGVAKEELEYAQLNNKQIYLSVQMTSDEGDNVSFAEEGKEVLYNEINKLKSLVNQDFGISIHHIKTWAELK